MSRLRSALLAKQDIRTWPSEGFMSPEQIRVWFAERDMEKTIMALHEQCVGASNEWYTPQRVFDALGCVFDLDVAHPGDERCVVPCARYLTHEDLSRGWHGFVWMNAPFGGRNGLRPWLDKFIRHGDGVCLVPDRTSAPWWQDAAAAMRCVLFVSPKIKFIGIDGLPGRSPAQGTCLMAMGDRGSRALHNAQTAKLGLLMRPGGEWSW